MGRKPPSPRHPTEKRESRGFKIDTTFLTDSSWGSAALVLQEISSTEHWRATHTSFTRWVRSAAEQSGVSESSIWRMISAARFYSSLGSRFGRVKLPPLTELSTIVTAEQIELIEKLTRVAPKNVIEKILASAVNGSLTRERLRDKWTVYRKEESKSRRAMASEGVPEKSPVARPNDSSLKGSSAAARAWISLLDADPSWTQIPHPHFYRALYDPPVRLTDTRDGGRETHQPDFLVVVQSEPRGKVEFHIVEMLSALGARGDLVGKARRIGLRAIQYADFFWIVLTEPPDATFIGELPRWIGLMSIGDGVPIVHKAPEHLSNAGKMAGDLAKALLVEVL